ncbi:MAG: hypothetical protein K0S11_1809, partial [Gammaproteobacteria bacterium]|nr:hypothetical protein [Gammaproteobacteria bacterium]
MTKASYGCFSLTLNPEPANLKKAFKTIQAEFPKQSTSILMACLNEQGTEYRAWAHKEKCKIQIDKQDIPKPKRGREILVYVANDYSLEACERNLLRLWAVLESKRVEIEYESLYVDNFLATGEKVPKCLAYADLATSARFSKLKIYPFQLENYGISTANFRKYRFKYYSNYLADTKKLENEIWVDFKRLKKQLDLPVLRGQSEYLTIAEDLDAIETYLKNGDISADLWINSLAAIKELLAHLKPVEPIESFLLDKPLVAAQQLQSKLEKLSEMRRQLSEPQNNQAYTVNHSGLLGITSPTLYDIPINQTNLPLNLKNKAQFIQLGNSDEPYYAILGTAMAGNQTPSALNQLTSAFASGLKLNKNEAIISLAYQPVLSEYSDSKLAQRAVNYTNQALTNYDKLVKPHQMMNRLIGQVDNHLKHVKTRKKIKQKPTDTDNVNFLAGRAFQTDENYKFVGFSVGNLILLAIDPLSLNCTTLIPAYLVADNHRLHRQTIEDTINESSILVALTPGVYRYLPQLLESDTAKITIDNKALKTYLSQKVSPNDSAQAYVNAIAKLAIDKANDSQVNQGEFVINSIRIPESPKLALLKKFLAATESKERENLLAKIVKTIPASQRHRLFEKLEHMRDRTDNVCYKKEDLEKALIDLELAYYQKQQSARRWRTIGIIAGAILLTPLSLLITLPLAWYANSREPIKQPPLIQPSQDNNGSTKIDPLKSQQANSSEINLNEALGLTISTPKKPAMVDTNISSYSATFFSGASSSSKMTTH